MEQAINLRQCVDQDGRIDQHPGACRTDGARYKRFYFSSSGWLNLYDNASCHLSIQQRVGFCRSEWPKTTLLRGYPLTLVVNPGLLSVIDTHHFVLVREPGQVPLHRVGHFLHEGSIKLVAWRRQQHLGTTVSVLRPLFIFPGPGAAGIDKARLHLLSLI